jgi:hypothetical protein
VPSPLRPLIDGVSQAIQDQDVQAFNAAVSRLGQTARDVASPAELTAALENLVPILRTAEGIVVNLAIIAGACVEWGGSPMPLSEVLPARTLSAMRSYELFPDVWRAASAGQPLPQDHSQDIEVAGIVADYAVRTGKNVALHRAAAVAWFDVANWIMPMNTCMAHREFRSALPAETVAKIRAAASAIAAKQGDWHADDTTRGAHFLEGLALVLDDEPLIVLDPASGRGFRLTMSGIGDNFQLHTLLADRLCGADGIPGLVPRRANGWTRQPMRRW